MRPRRLIRSQNRKGRWRPVSGLPDPPPLTISRNTWGLRFVSRFQFARWWRAMPDPDPREQLQLRLSSASGFAPLRPTSGPPSASPMGSPLSPSGDSHGRRAGASAATETIDSGHKPETKSDQYARACARLCEQMRRNAIPSSRWKFHDRGFPQECGGGWRYSALALAAARDSQGQVGAVGYPAERGVVPAASAH
jgi:hypothetical protein